ncbi:hypothetical protein D3C87_1236810 [compost metagenome]
MVVRGLHDLIPELAGRHAAVDPEAVVAAVGAGGDHVHARLGLVDQFHLAIGLHSLHEGIGHADRDIEVGEVALVLGVDKALDIGVVAAQHAHLGAAPGAGGLHGGAGGIEYLHERDRAGRARVRRAHQRPAGADGREVVAHPAAAPHGLGRLGHRRVDAGLAVTRLGNRVAHGLDKAVDQRGLDTRAGGGIDPPCRHEAVLQRPEEARGPHLAPVGRLDLGQRTRHAGTHIGNGAFLALGVLLQQHFGGDVLRRQRAAQDLVVCVHVLAHSDGTIFPARHAASDPPAHSPRQIKLARTNRIPTNFGTSPAGCDTMPVGRASSHGGAVNLVRSGTKQPQPFSISAEGQARPPYSFAAFLRGTSS